MKRLLLVLLALVALWATPASAAIVQTITVDGVNDFDPSNLLGDDAQDTQSNCGTGIFPMDIGQVYVTNDANFLYIGFQFAKSCYCDMNVGLAIDVNSAGGGTTDPFGRKIGWANVPFKPDWVIYDVTPTNCNTFNYEVLYKDTVGTWVNRSTLLNPAWGSGSNGLGIIDSTSFRELKLPLSLIGATAGTPLHLEFWVTQEGTLKGPLDAFSSDNVQMSRFSQTTYDTAAVVQMTSMATYTVLNAVDATPPTVTSAQAVNFAVQANKQFSLVTNKIDVTFSEPVELLTSQTAANYTLTGPVSRTVISAVRDGAATNVVHLTLSGVINANAAQYNVRALNVKDPANNVIVGDNVGNIRSFFIQNLIFNGNFKVGMCAGTFTAADTFAIEGSIIPLSFAICDNALMTDANSDSIYTVTVPFCLPVNPSTGKGESDLEWKFSTKCSTFEPLGSNRNYHLSSDNGASVTITESWNNDDPANYTTRPVDVVFKVNAAHANPGPSDVITLLGNIAPLHFSQPGLAMLDNGVAPDAVAGDKIYTARVTFPACSPKNVNWKVDFNGVIECLGQGDRTVYLNDALFSSANPIVLPARGIDRCTVTDKPLTVVFKVQMDGTSPLPALPTDTLAVMGSVAPLSWGVRPAAALLLNDGAGYDATAGDIYYTRAITFPDSSAFNVEFKYWLNGQFECGTSANRTLTLDDVNHTSGSPIVRVMNVFDVCSDVAAVNPGGSMSADFATLRPVLPNPVSRRASFSFELHRTGHVALRVYDVTGRRVASLLDANLPVGVHSVSWDGRGTNGLRLSSGVYLYELSMGRDRVTRRLILTN
ncbi:MAG: T9SS type A sorting domain-containing protein [Candidatus Eisenbacteria bacterium]|uniref:T9SS type A sorting domain-containing protein n=1 Tax=Eiseniibacteriota bacterium TaxID=2212470 RepID=A0A933W9R9_UNCEI|nr:T9SS type A sorting domain-containing protein [Candidatus Eisenbacteria bacterium]